MPSGTKNYSRLLALTLLGALFCSSGPMALAEPSGSAQPARAVDVGSSNESASENLVTAFREGEFRLGLRYRFEHVDDDAFSDTAQASTLRSTMSYRTGDWRGWSLFLQAEDVSPVFDDDGYANAGRNGRGNGVQGVPVIADPAGTAMGQAYLRWSGSAVSGNPKVSIGRQEINLGDQRFVGAVGWRQHHQSFDAARLEWALGLVDLDYSYLSSVNRIFGDGQTLDGHLLQLSFQPLKEHRVTAYGFVLDFDELRALSTSTYGVEVTGHLTLGRFGLRYEVEAALQDDAGDNPNRVDTDYRRASIGSDVGPTRFDLAWELLGGAGDGDLAFATPLATLHKWNGWADKFLRTPIAGLETTSLHVRGPGGKHLTWTAAYLDFGADDGGREFGSEVDAELVYKTPWGQTMALKAAFYRASSATDVFEDTRKLMLWTSYSFQ